MHRDEEECAAVRSNLTTSTAAMERLKRVRVSSAATARANVDVNQRLQTARPTTTAATATTLSIKNTRATTTTTTTVRHFVQRNSASTTPTPAAGSVCSSVASCLLRPSSVTTRHVQQQQQQQRHGVTFRNTVGSDEKMKAASRVTSFASQHSQKPLARTNTAGKSWRVMRAQNTAEAQEATAEFQKHVDKQERRQKRRDDAAFKFKANDDDDYFLFDYDSSSSEEDEEEGSEGESATGDSSSDDRRDEKTTISAGNNPRTPQRPTRSDTEGGRVGGGGGGLHDIPFSPPSVSSSGNFIVRNARQIKTITAVMHGALDPSERFHDYAAHAADVQQRMVVQFKAEQQRRERNVELEKQKCTRAALQRLSSPANIEALEHLAVRVCAWSVVAALAQSWSAVLRICRSQARVESERRRHDAASVLGRHLPAMMRRRKRGKAQKRLAIASADEREGFGGEGEGGALEVEGVTPA